MKTFAWTRAALALACGCGHDVAGNTGFGSGGSTSGEESSGTAADSADDTVAGSEASGASSSGEGNPGKFDVGVADDTGATQCAVGEMDGELPCRAHAPPDSFEPAVQWTWTGASEPYSVVVPLVANLTDDNGDDT